MAEKTQDKKPRAPRKPKAPKAEPAVINPENQEALEKFEEEAAKPVVEDNNVAEVPSPVLETESSAEEPVEDLEEPAESITTVDEPSPEAELELPDDEIKPAELPEGAETFEEFSQSLETSPAEIKKLNPNLPDTRSKWVAQIPTKTGRHIIFKGSYPRALQAAENWNKARNLKSGFIKKIRSN